MAAIFIGVGLISFFILYIDVIMGRYQMMPIMNIAWPITGLYLGPLALWAYFAWGRAKKAMSMGSMSKKSSSMKMDMSQHSMNKQTAKGMAGKKAKAKKSKLSFKALFLASTHCASGCVLGDLVSEFLIHKFDILIFSPLMTSYILDYIFAFAFGILFQYFTIVPMRKLSFGKGLVESIKADVLSLSAFQVGMYIWIGIMFNIYGAQFSGEHLFFWAMMQVGLICGFITNVPMNALLIKMGIKKPCH